MELWRGLQAVFNGTKRNVVASSGSECLIWGMEETGPWGGEGGGCRVWEGSRLKEGVCQRREGEKRGFLGAGRPRGHFQERQADGGLPGADSGG